MRSCAICSLVLALTTRWAVGQSIPAFTAEREKAVNELLLACVQSGGMTLESLPGDKGRFLRVASREKVQVVLTARRDRLGAEVRDGLLAYWFRANEASKPAVAELLHALGRLKKDDFASGLASYLAGMTANRQGHPGKALQEFRKALPLLEQAAATDWQASCLGNLGFLLIARSASAEAVACFTEALRLHRKLYPRARFPKGHPQLATGLSNLGFALAERASYREALAHHREALAMRCTLYPGGHAELALSLANVAGVLHARGAFAEATRHYQEALRVCRKLYPVRRYPDGHADLAVSLNNLGFALNAQGLFAEAARCFTEALTVYRKLYPAARFPDGHPLIATGLSNLGSVLDAQGQLAEGSDCHEQALAMRRRLYPPERYPDGHPDLAVSLNNLGSALEAQGRYAQAVPYNESALAMRRKLYPPTRFPKGHPLVAASLNNLGTLLAARGLYADALQKHQQALAMRRRLYPPPRYPNGHPDLAVSLNNIGRVRSAQGAYRQALALYQQALAMKRTFYPATEYPNGHPDLALALNNLGSAFEAQGDPVAAAAWHGQALAMRRKLYPPASYPNGHPELVSSLNNVGGTLRSQDRYAEALDCYRQAAALARKIYLAGSFPNGHPLLATSLQNVGSVLALQGKYDEALLYCRRAHEVDAKLYPAAAYPDGHPELSLGLNSLGNVLAEQGRHEEALRAFAEALQSLRTASGRPDLDAGADAARLLRPQSTTGLILRNRAMLLERTLSARPSVSKLRRAERAFALAAVLQDRLRGEVLHERADKLQHGEAADRLLPRHLAILARLVEADGKAADLAAAFQAIEQGRSRVFLESLGEAHAAALAGLPANLAAEERRLSLTLRELDARIQRLSLQPGDEPARQVRQLYADRLQLEEQEKVFLDKLRHSHSQYAGFRHPKPCSVAEARSCLGDNEVALLFAVGADFSYALLLEKVLRPGDPGQGVALVRLPGGKELNPLLGTLLTSATLQHPARARDLAAELYRKLLGPLQDRLKGKDLLVVPDGALALLPFELLVEGQTDDDEGHWLIEQHRVRYAPSLSALHLSRQVKRQKPTQLLWAVADPLFGDKFRRLANSGREVESICKVLGVPVEKTLRGACASEAAVKAARDELAQARFVHFATHGIVSERSAYATALVLNQVGNDGKEELGGINDGFLRLPEITFLKLNADVVVLSACETARGRRSGGEGVSGLARTFLYAGSRGVVCSLWSVDDSRTADLMRIFYKGLKDGLPAPEALRRARLALLGKGLAPFFWAPFVLMGQ